MNGDFLASAPCSEIFDDDEDEILYTESYRKRDYVEGNNTKTPNPFKVALVKEIRKEGDEVRLRVQLCYRPENTHLGPKAAEEADYNKLYWSEKEAIVPFEALRGRCYVKFSLPGGRFIYSHDSKWIYSRG